MHIRPLQSQDLPGVEHIYDLYWSGDFRKNLSQKLKNREGLNYFIAEENGKVVGVAAFRKIPEHLKQYAKTDNAVEFYILAVLEKGKGVGEALRLKRIEEAKKLGYKEVVLFSGETHKDSWGFHDRLGFEQVGEAVAPNGEKGQIWRKSLL